MKKKLINLSQGHRTKDLLRKKARVVTKVLNHLFSEKIQVDLRLRNGQDHSLRYDTIAIQKISIIQQEEGCVILIPADAGKNP